MRFIRTTDGYINIDCILEFRGIGMDKAGEFATHAMLKDGSNVTFKPSLYLDATVLYAVLPATAGVWATVVTVDDGDFPPSIERYPVIGWIMYAKDVMAMVLPIDIATNQHVYLETGTGGYYDGSVAYDSTESLLAAHTRKTPVG